MKPILIPAYDIVDTLKVNKEAFVESYDALLEQWTILNDAFQEEYREWSVRFGQQKLEEEEKEPCPPPKPVNRTNDYDFYIGYFNTDLRSNIEMLESMDIKDNSMLQNLNEQEYRKFMLDQWSWTSSHFASLTWYNDNAIAGSSAAVIRRAHRNWEGKISL